MKKLTLTALAVMSINAYALEHINEHQEFTGKGATGNFQVIEEKMTPITESEKKNLTYNLVASTQNYYGRTHTNIAMQGYHQVNIYNMSNMKSIYTVSLYLCALSMYCANNTYNIAVDAGNHYYVQTNSLLNATFVNPANYTLQAGSRLSGAETGLAYLNKILNIEL